MDDCDDRDLANGFVSESVGSVKSLRSSPERRLRQLGFVSAGGVAPSAACVSDSFGTVSELAGVRAPCAAGESDFGGLALVLLGVFDVAPFLVTLVVPMMRLLLRLGMAWLQVQLIRRELCMVIRLWV